MALCACYLFFQWRSIQAMQTMQRKMASVDLSWFCEFVVYSLTCYSTRWSKRAGYCHAKPSFHRTDEEWNIGLTPTKLLIPSLNVPKKPNIYLSCSGISATRVSLTIGHTELSNSAVTCQVCLCWPSLGLYVGTVWNRIHNHAEKSSWP